MKKITIFQVLLGCFLLVCHTSCQKSEELTSIKPTPQQIINAIKDSPEYTNYLNINIKIRELMPSVIKGATTEQKVTYNNLRGKYATTAEFLKGNNLKTLEIVSNIMKPIADLQKERLQIIQLIHNKVSLKYKLELNEVTSALLQTNLSNARIAQSCASQALSAAVQAYGYILEEYGDSGFAYNIADFVYSETYRSCMDPINGGGHTAIA